MMLYHWFSLLLSQFFNRKPKISIAALLRPSAASVVARNVNVDGYKDPRAEDGVLLHQTTTVVANTVLDIVHSACIGAETPFEDQIGKEVESCDSEFVETPSDAEYVRTDEFFELSVQIRGNVARTLVRCEVDEVELVLLSYFAFAKDLSAPVTPEQQLDAEGDKFWYRLRAMHGGLRYRWILCKLVICGELLYDAGIYKPIQVLEGDDLFDFIDTHLDELRVPVGMPWEVDDFRASFDNNWSQFSHQP